MVGRKLSKITTLLRRNISCQCIAAASLSSWKIFYFLFLFFSFFLYAMVSSQELAERMREKLAGPAVKEYSSHPPESAGDVFYLRDPLKVSVHLLTSFHFLFLSCAYRSGYWKSARSNIIRQSWQGCRTCVCFYLNCKLDVIEKAVGEGF